MVGRVVTLVVAAAQAAIFCVAAEAQERPPLTTDRPDQTESPTAIAPGLVQIELGGVHEVSGGSDERLTAVGGLLARIGLVPRVELRLGFVGWQRVEGMGTASSGFGDVSAGVKVALLEGAGLVPAVGMIGTALVPVGDREFRAGGVDPVVRAALAHDLGAGFSLSYNLGIGWLSVADPGGGDRTVTESLYTVAVGRGFGPVGVFVEGFGIGALSDGARSWHALDGGLTYGLTPTVQLDASVGVGLTEAASDWFVGLGLAFRVPR